MLKSTRDPLTKEQFSKLQEARQLIKTQFDAEFALQSDELIDDLYGFALNSETNELFTLFIELNEIFDAPLEHHLNEEQFIMLRQAKGLIATEISKTLLLIDSNVMDKLYEFALASRHEDLFDIYRYLGSRADQPDRQTNPVSGPKFRKLREAKRLIGEQFEQDIQLHSETVTETMAGFAERSKDVALVETVHWLSNSHTDAPGVSELLFNELSTSSFQQLRQAKIAIRDEFDEEFSLHAQSAMNDLYDFALRSEGVMLFDVFCDLLEPQMAPRSSIQGLRDWYSKEQFTLLRSVRGAIQTEFDETLQLQSSTLHNDLYQFALRSVEEHLFDLCWELQQLSTPNVNASTLPSKEEFRMLRRARTLVNEEFSQELPLHPYVVEPDLYKFAVSSETDDLFELYTDLMTLPSRSDSAASAIAATRLAKDELAALRVARRLVLTEFGEHLALEVGDVLDRLYEFALKSEGEELFDLHSKLNAKALEEGVVAQTKVAPVPVERQPTLDNAEPPQENQTRSWLHKVINLWGNRSPSEQPNEITDAATVVKEAAIESQLDQPPLHPINKPAAEPKPTSPNASFPDKLMRATEQANHTGQVTNSPNDQWAWYLSTLDNRFRVSLSKPLSVKTNGELVVAASSDSQPSAIIELVTNKPVISVQDCDLLVNNQRVKDMYELASGDTFAVAGTVLRVEYLPKQPNLDDASHSRNPRERSTRRSSRRMR